MNYMKRNVNIFLLFLIVIMLGSFATFTVTWKNIEDDLQGDKSELVNLYTDTAENLALREAQLNVTLEEFAVKQTREQSLSDRYSDIRDVNAQLTLDLAQTRKDLADTELILEAAKQDVEAKEARIVTLQDDITDLNSQISSLKNEIEDLEADLDACEAT